MSSNPFSDFIAFIEADRKVLELESQKMRLEHEIKKLDDEIASQQGIVTELKSQVSAAQRAVHEQELELASVKQRDQIIDARLESVISPKEYTSLIQEREALYKHKENLEDILLARWQDHEEALKLMHTAQEALLKFMSGTQAIVHQKNADLGVVTQQIALLIAERASCETQAPRELMENYYAMRATVSDPIVPLERDYCSACHYQVSRQDSMQIHQHKLVPCTQCYRLLYAVRT